MITKEIADSILTIGCEYRSPKGGIAQVIDSYSKYVFATFLFSANSAGKSKMCKFIKCISVFIEVFSRLIIQRRIKIVHIHTASRNSFRRSILFIRLAKMMRRKVVVHIHGGGFKEYYASNSEFVRKYLLMADCVIALSESWRDFFISKVGLSNVQIVHNIVPQPQKESLKVDGVLHGLFLGKICKEKGIYDLLRAIELERDNLDGRFLLHVGGGGEVDQLQHFILEHGLKDIVRYEGWVDLSRKPYLLNLCRLYILPSYVEGLPVSILEAMSYGEAILSTPIGGIPEVVTPDIGKLVSPGDVSALAFQLRDFLFHPEKVSALGRQAEKNITTYLPESVSRELLEVYMPLL